MEEAPGTSQHRGDGSPGVCWVEDVGCLPQGLCLSSVMLPFTSFQSYHGDIDLPVVVRDGMLASVQNFPWEGYPSTPPHEALQTRLWLPLLLHPPNPCLISISYVIDSINHRAASLLESWFLQASFLTMLTLRNKGHLEHFKTIAWLARLLSFANAILSNISKTLNFFSLS